MAGSLLVVCWAEVFKWMNFCYAKRQAFEFFFWESWGEGKQNYHKKKTLIQQHKNESRSDEEYTAERRVRMEAATFKAIKYFLWTWFCENLWLLRYFFNKINFFFLFFHTENACHINSKSNFPQLLWIFKHIFIGFSLSIEKFIPFFLAFVF